MAPLGKLNEGGLLTWPDEECTRLATCEQGEGGEQGDPLMPALFALAQHETPVEAKRKMHSDDHLFAFLDDLYVATTRDRAWSSFCAVTQEVAERAGVHTREGKLRTWCRGGGDCPAGFESYPPEVWTGAATPARRGVKVLGTPLGDPAFVASVTNERLEKQRQFMERISEVEDLQCAWLLLLYCAVPRANHLLRILPPSISKEYAVLHDAALWSCTQTLLGGAQIGDACARAIATLPARLGGLGLRSA